MARWSWSVLGVVLIASSCRDSTGLHLVGHVGGLHFDELRVGIARAPDSSGASTETLVDPETNGRYPGPFRPGDQDVYVYLADDLDGVRLRCSLTALDSSEVVGQGEADTTVQRHEIETVEILMDASGSGSGGGTPAGPDGAASSGSGGAPPPGSMGNVTGGAGGTGGAPGSQKLANGQRCNSAAECATGQCIDGFCCESDCSGACTSCSQPGAEGLCRPAPAGIPDPRGICADMGAATCGTTGLCDVSGHCGKYTAGTMCAAASCKNDGMVTPAAACDGSGKCLKGPATKCPAGCADGACL